MTDPTLIKAILGGGASGVIAVLLMLVLALMREDLVPGKRYRKDIKDRDDRLRRFDRLLWRMAQLTSKVTGVPFDDTEDGEA